VSEGPLPRRGSSQYPSLAELLNPPLDFVIELLTLKIDILPNGPATAGIEGNKINRPEDADYGKHEQAAHDRQIVFLGNLQ
jgi:hypothetical protein